MRVEAIRVQEDIDELIRRMGSARDDASRNALRTEIAQKQKTLARLLGS
jgi:hypothetical protein